VSCGPDGREPLPEKKKNDSWEKPDMMIHGNQNVSLSEGYSDLDAEISFHRPFDNKIDTRVRKIDFSTTCSYLNSDHPIEKTQGSVTGPKIKILQMIPIEVFSPKLTMAAECTVAMRVANNVGSTKSYDNFKIDLKSALFTYGNKVTLVSGRNLDQLDGRPLIPESEKGRYNINFRKSASQKGKLVCQNDLPSPEIQIDQNGDIRGWEMFFVDSYKNRIAGKTITHPVRLCRAIGLKNDLLSETSELFYIVYDNGESPAKVSFESKMAPKSKKSGDLVIGQLTFENISDIDTIEFGSFAAPSEIVISYSYIGGSFDGGVFRSEVQRINRATAKIRYDLPTDEEHFMKSPTYLGGGTSYARSFSVPPTSARTVDLVLNFGSRVPPGISDIVIHTKLDRFDWYLVSNSYVFGAGAQEALIPFENVFEFRIK
jgi:hypothetical protein